MSRRVEVCLSPRLIDCYDIEQRIVVVTDVLRATSAMVAGLANGIAAIRAVETVAESMAMREAGYLAAAERDGQVVEGFDFGNSPLAFLQPDLKGRKVALTTTNGTRAIALAGAAKEVILGAFINLEAVINFLKERDEDVLILCAGWKNNFNIEDSLFAGAVVAGLQAHSVKGCDAGLAMTTLYKSHRNDLFGFIQQSSHYQRLAKMGIEEDIRYCMQESIFEVVPRWVDQEFII